MPRAAPSFPAFDEWQKLSESQQDVLLDQLEASGRSDALFKRVLIGVLCITVCAVIGAALATTPV